MEMKWLTKDKYEGKKDYLEETFFEYERRKEYLEGKFPEIASKKGGNRRVTNKRMKGGNIYKDAQRTEEILRSAFAILYAAWEDGQEWVDSKKEKWGKEKLAMLYNRFKEPHVSDNKTKKSITEKSITQKAITGDSPYAYYIPFVKKQVEDANIPDLKWMYDRLFINEKERKQIRIPMFIQNYLYAFLQSKRSAEDFLQGSMHSTTSPIRAASVKKASTKRSMTLANLPKLISQGSMSFVPQFVSAIRRGGRRTHKKKHYIKKNYSKKRSK